MLLLNADMRVLGILNTNQQVYNVNTKIEQTSKNRTMTQKDSPFDKKVT